MAEKSEKNLEELPVQSLDGKSVTVEQCSTKSSTLISIVVLDEVMASVTAETTGEFQRDENESTKEIDLKSTDKIKVDTKLLCNASPTLCMDTTNVSESLTKEVTYNIDEGKMLRLTSKETKDMKENPSLNATPQNCEVSNSKIADISKDYARNRETQENHDWVKYSSNESSHSSEKLSAVNFGETDSNLNAISLLTQENTDVLSFHTAASAHNTGNGNNSNIVSEMSKPKVSADKNRRSSEELVSSVRGHFDPNEEGAGSRRLRLSLDENNSGELLIHVSDSRESDTYPGLQWLPDQLLDAVLQWLPFADVSRVGGTCRRLRRVAAVALRREMRSLVTRVESAMGALELETTAQAQGGACMVPVVMRVILHTVLRVLLGEARVLRAVCWRYMRMDEINSLAESTSHEEHGGRQPYDPAPVVCFPGGDLFDEFERLLDMVCVDNFCNDIDPEVVTGLFMRMEKFLDFFEGSVEPLLRCGETPFGVKVVDLLGACDTADCAVSVTHGASDRPFLVTVNFELRDASAVDSPPPFDGQMPSLMRLRLLARYLRNNVRWVNFFRPMRELWDLQDEIENRWTPSATGEHRDISRHHPLHQVVMDAMRAKAFRRNLGMPPPIPSPPHLPRKQIRQREMYEQVVLRAEPPLWRETFSRRINPAVRALRLGLSCNLELSGCDKSMLPLDLEFLDEERIDSATRHPGLSPQSSHVRSGAMAGIFAADHVVPGRTVTAGGSNNSFAETAPRESALISSTATGSSGELRPTKEPSDARIGAVVRTPTTPLPQPEPQRLPPPMTHGEIPLDWGPWLRLRRNYRSATAQNGQATDGWDDYGSSIRCGGEYGFRGEVRVTFPPRALSSIVTETVIQVSDTTTETNITSDRRWFFYL